MIHGPDWMMDLAAYCETEHAEGTAEMCFLVDPPVTLYGGQFSRFTTRYALPVGILKIGTDGSTRGYSWHTVKQ